MPLNKIKDGDSFLPSFDELFYDPSTEKSTPADD
jgi:hypothetical protein